MLVSQTYQFAFDHPAEQPPYALGALAVYTWDDAATPGSRLLTDNRGAIAIANKTIPKTRLAHLLRFDRRRPVANLRFPTWTLKLSLASCVSCTCSDSERPLEKT